MKPSLAEEVGRTEPSPARFEQPAAACPCAGRRVCAAGAFLQAAGGTAGGAGGAGLPAADLPSIPGMFLWGHPVISPCEMHPHSPARLSVQLLPCGSEHP